MIYYGLLHVQKVASFTTYLPLIWLWFTYTGLGNPVLGKF